MKAWGRLLRLSLAPTAAADIAAGAIAGAAGRPFLESDAVGLLALILASLCVYHGGMTLNDWADREQDRRVRPDRPIPSGAVRPGAALLVGTALLLAGPLIAWRSSAESGLVLLAVSAAAIAYDLRLRGAWTGPLLLAMCRAGNLSAGIVFTAASPLEVRAFLPALIYGAYVFSVSRLGRLEDAPEHVLRSSSPSLQLILAAAILAASPAVALVHPSDAHPSDGHRPDGLLRLVGAFVLAASGAAGLLAAARHPGPWTGPELTRATGLGLRRLLVFTAALALSTGGAHAPIVAAAILLGYPVSYALRGVFPPS
jgi:4-hydroxybenzoate polyprenyltransferase